ncbi:MAG: lamin tail domain-containing protein [Chloroflexi bacterium]|nr:MAG: lamin tail domain-containing protein [Chloroflexota bacterium]
MFAHKLVGSLVFLCGLIVLVGVKRPLPAHAQSGCALRINEIMYDPASGLGVDARAEWVELFVALDIAVDTTFFITDQDAPAAGEFAKVFTLPAGTAAGSFVVIHNDGNPVNDNPTSSPIEFYMGNNSLKLNNNGDEVVLYQGGDATGEPCDYVEYLTPNSPMPAGFSWDISGCPTPASSQDYGTSISLDPNGVESDSACDWAESGLNSPNDPGTPFTGGPETEGITNTISPTAVSLASFTATKSQSATVSASMAFVLMAALTGWGWFKHRK